ncbi:MAG: glycosyltransferase family A protein, partial [Rhodococcus sp. (in: high G+C Gram-positive bacteria)]
MLPPALPRLQSPEWDGAVWIGDIDLELDLPESLDLDDSDGYHRARLLIRRGLDPLGFVELDVVDGAVAAADVRAAAMSLAQVPTPDALPDTDRALPPITVVICTRDRVDHLKGALASVSALDYPDFEVVVVDNASPTDATQRYV